MTIAFKNDVGVDKFHSPVTFILYRHNGFECMECGKIVYAKELLRDPDSDPIWPGQCPHCGVRETLYADWNALGNSDA